MSVRFFVTSASLMIFSWLAATYLRAVPMDTYPGTPSIGAGPVEAPETMAAALGDDSVTALETASAR